MASGLLLLLLIRPSDVASINAESPAPVAV
jgi:hypothetical protein